ncbi:MAG: Tad domain-containing protein [Planctomycetota bacterium]
MGWDRASLSTPVGSRWLVKQRRSSRRGYSLVFVVLMLFGIMALAGSVIDLGFARLAQRQMQVAADSAAIEGLRGEGAAPYIDRRESARDFVHWHFDDDLDAAGTYPLDDDGAFGTGSGQFGAGPQLTFSGGLGDPSLDASRTIEVDPDNPVFKPVMEDGTQSAAGTFQVALRRGGTTVPTADLYSQGSAVPYLFARGSLSNRQLISRGINVGANGVAEPRLAMSVGAPQPAQGMVGSLGMAIELGTWQTGTQPIASTNCFISNARVVGDPVTNTNAVLTNQTGLVGLFLDTPEIDRRVVAFGFASVDASGGVTVDTSQLVALENASAVFVSGFDPGTPISAILEAIGPDGAALALQPGIVHASVSVR